MRFKKCARVVVPALVACLVVGCSIFPSSMLRSSVTSMAIGGGGSADFLRSRILCPIIVGDQEFGAVGQIGRDGSLWHIVEIVGDAFYGCTAETERLRVEPNIVPLDRQGRPKWLPYDLVSLTVVDPADTTAAISRSERREFNSAQAVERSAARQGALGAGVLDEDNIETETLRRVVRGNRRGN